MFSTARTAAMAKRHARSPRLPSALQGQHYPKSVGVECGSKRGVWQQHHLALFISPHTSHAVSAFPLVSAQTESMCYYQMVALAAPFPHFLKLFVFCQSGAHFASPWQAQMYFLLGLNTLRKPDDRNGSQRKPCISPNCRWKRLRLCS